MLGIRVTDIDDARQTVSSLPYSMVESLGSVRAGSLFSVLARYRLADVVGLMEGVCPHPMPIPRSLAPTGSIPVCHYKSMSIIPTQIASISMDWRIGSKRWKNFEIWSFEIPHRRTLLPNPKVRITNLYCWKALSKLCLVRRRQKYLRTSWLPPCICPFWKPLFRTN